MRKRGHLIKTHCIHIAWALAFVLRCTASCFSVQEQALGQKFIVDLQLEHDLRKAGGTDCLDDTLDYAKVFKCALKLTHV